MALTATNLAAGTTVLIWEGITKVERTVASITETVDSRTMELLQVTVKWTNGIRTSYLPDAEFTTV